MATYGGQFTLTFVQADVRKIDTHLYRVRLNIRDRLLFSLYCHRQLLGRESDTGKRLRGRLPVACINPERKGQAASIAATIRHNRARGKHQITSMSDIVRDLARLGWTD